MGFDDAGTPAPGRPRNLEQYDQDSVNGIVKRFAEPLFHCTVDLVQHPDSGLTYPVITVPGGHRAPIRSNRSGPGEKHVKQNTYYIRRSGPESAPISTGREWDELIARCISAARHDLLSRLQAMIVGGDSTEGLRSTDEALTDWSDECLARFNTLRPELGEEEPSRYALGYWTFSYLFQPEIDVTIEDLDRALRTAQGSETGWPAWIVMDSEDLHPYAYEGVIECSLHRAGRDGAHSDFWRASPHGRLFLLRGYQEDGGDGHPATSRTPVTSSVTTAKHQPT